MKPATFKLDRHIHGLLEKGDLHRFTVRSMREAYVEQLTTAAGVPPVDLWRYIYEQVGRLVRVGWVLRDEQRRRRDQLYCVHKPPESISVNLVDSPFGRDSRDTFVECLHRVPPADVATCQRLESLVKEIRLDMLSFLGEAERYKQLLTEMPQLKAQLEDEYVQARDRSSRLLGHLRAVEKTLKSLAGV